MDPARAWMLVLVVLPLVAGCASGPAGVPKTLDVSSPTIDEGGTVPDVHTCDGPNRSPALDVTSLPDGTRTIALIVTDPDAPSVTFIHWVVWDAPASGGVVSFPEGSAPDGAIEGRNSAGDSRYTGPCPPAGGGPHKYHFKAYAIDMPLGLEPGSGHTDLLAAMDGRVLAWGELVASYERS